MKDNHTYMDTFCMGYACYGDYSTSISVNWGKNHVNRYFTNGETTAISEFPRHYIIPRGEKRHD